MFVTRIAISREGYHGGYVAAPDASKPFHATVEVLGSYGKTELRLSPELSARVVAVIGDEIVAAGKATAEAMTAQALDVVALPAAEATASAERLPF